MKGVILNFDEISDSTEIYDSKPHPFLSIFIILVSLLLMSAITWMALFKIDIVIEGSGIVKTEYEPVDEIALVSGTILSCYVKDGQTVEAGELLYEVNHDDIDEEILYYEAMIDDYDMQINIMNAYLISIEERTNQMENLNENPYYNDYLVKYNLYINKYNTYKENYTDSSIQKLNLENLLLEEKNLINFEIKSINEARNEAEKEVGILNKTRETYFCYAKIKGYVNFETDLNNTNYMVAGNKILEIFPIDQGEYFVDIYVNSKDIAGIEEGLEVKYESSSFKVESDAKVIKGNVISMSRTAKVVDNNGNSYYVLRADIDNTKENIIIKNDMNCQVDIVVGRETILKHLLKKINILD